MSFTEKISRSVFAATAVALMVSCAGAAQKEDNAQKEGETVSQTTSNDGAGGGSSAPKGFVKPSAPMPVDSYIVDLPATTYKSAKNKELNVEAQFLFLNQETAKKAFGNKEELQKVLADVFKTSKIDFKTPAGKVALKGEVLAKLFERGYEAEGVLWNGFRF